jgi:hypothetical protein
VETVVQNFAHDWLIGFQLSSVTGICLLLLHWNFERWNKDFRSILKSG